MESPSYPAVTKLPLERHFGRFVALLSGYFICAFAYAAYSRFHYPFELDLIEGGMLEQVRHVSQGQPLYAKPALDFIAFIYGPLFTYIGAVSSYLLGNGFENIRFISILSTIASCIAISCIVRRSAQSASLGFCAIGLFLATYAGTGFSFDQGRVDSLFLALLLWGFYFLRFGSLSPGIVSAALLFAAAFFTKQVAILAILCVIPVARQRGMRAMITFASLLGLLCIGGGLILCWLTDGWYYYYSFNLPAQHDIRVAFYKHFWIGDIAMAMPLCVILALCGLRIQARSAKDDAFISSLCLLSGFLLLSWVSRLHAGGIENVLAPAYAALAICAVSAIKSFKSLLSGYALLFLQFLILIHPPTAAVPPPTDLSAGEHVLRTISHYPGDVFVPYHPYLLSLSDKPTHAHQWALYDVLRGDPNGEGANLRRELDAALANQQFSAILSDDNWFRDQIERSYKLKAKLFDDERAFRPLFGETRARPEFLFEPRISPPSTGP